MDKKTKESIFPWIKDWTLSYQDVKQENPKQQDFQTYFWFSPVNYKIMHYGFNIIGLLLCLGVALLSYFYHIYVATVLLVIFAVIFFMATLRAHKTYIEGMTFYDKHMREYPVKDYKGNIVTVMEGKK